MQNHKLLFPSRGVLRNSYKLKRGSKKMKFFRRNSLMIQLYHDSSFCYPVKICEKAEWEREETRMDVNFNPNHVIINETYVRKCVSLMSFWQYSPIFYNNLSIYTLSWKSDRFDSQKKSRMWITIFWLKLRIRNPVLNNFFFKKKLLFSIFSKNRNSSV